MTVHNDIGLAVNWPMTRVINAWWIDRTEEEQRKDIDKGLRTIEDMVSGAHAYLLANAAGKQPNTDIRYEAMRGIFTDREVLLQESGKSPISPSVTVSVEVVRTSNTGAQDQVFIAAQDYDQIVQGVTLCISTDSSASSSAGAMHRCAPSCSSGTTSA